MTIKKDKRPYKPPQILGLSSRTAEGEIQGQCVNGNQPYANCAVGTAAPGVGDCSVGTNPNIGAYCDGGSVPSNFCQTGTQA